MTRFTHFRWGAALTLAIALAPGAASAQENGTIAISSTFSPSGLLPTVGADLAEIYANGHDHTWTLTLYGTTQSHSTGSFLGGVSRKTTIHATSFDLEFFGPDAATLNGIVSEHIAGGEVSINLQNIYRSWESNTAFLWIELYGSGVSFWVGHDTFGFDTLFPVDPNGYPVVGQEPFSIESEYSWLGDYRGGNDGGIEGWYSLVTFAGSVGEPDPGEPVALAVANAAVLEGNRGTSNLAVAVTLSRGSSQTITVSYATANGTAAATQDYAATSGTLTFQPGETSRTISIAVKGDRKREANETFSVQLSNAVGAPIDDGVAAVTILNDD